MAARVVVPAEPVAVPAEGSGRRQLGEILVARSLLSRAQLKDALLKQRVSGKRLGTLLVELGALDERDLAAAVGEHFGVAVVDLRLRAPEPQAVAMLARGGTAVAIGVPPPDSTVTIGWSGGVGAAYPTKSTLRITDGGDPLLEDFARWIGWAVEGRLDLKAMVTRELPLTDAGIAEALRAMLAGEVVRSVVRVA